MNETSCQAKAKIVAYVQKMRKKRQWAEHSQEYSICPHDRKSWISAFVELFDCLQQGCARRNHGEPRFHDIPHTQIEIGARIRRSQVKALEKVFPPGGQDTGTDGDNISQALPAAKFSQGIRGGKTVQVRIPMS